jgi:hypothetical protein
MGFVKRILADRVEAAALRLTVIPAKAGIQTGSLSGPATYELDSRFRGNDWCCGRPQVPNDASATRRDQLLSHLVHAKLVASDWIVRPGRLRLEVEHGEEIFFPSDGHPLWNGGSLCGAPFSAAMDGPAP